MKKQKVLSFILSFTLMVSVFALNFTAVFAATTTLSQIDAKSVEFRINSNSSINIYWAKVSGAGYYQIAYQKTPVKSGSYSYLTTYTNQATITPFDTDSVYAIQIRAISGTGSNTVYGKWSATKLYQKNLNLKISNKSNGIRAEWEKINNAQSYIVYYKETGADKWNSISTANTYYPLLRLSSGTKYSVQIQPVFTNVSKGNYSSVKSLIYIPQVKPVITSLTNEKSGVNVKWKAVTGTEKYIVYYSKSSSKGPWNKTEVTSTNTTLDWSTLDVAFGKTFYVQVQCIFPNNNKGLYSKVFSHTDIESHANITGEVDKVQDIILKWPKMTGCAYYMIDLFELSGLAWSGHKTNSMGYIYDVKTNTNSYTMFGFAHSKKQYNLQVRISGYDSSGNLKQVYNWTDLPVKFP